jgi:hypothetical protein
MSRRTAVAVWVLGSLLMSRPPHRWHGGAPALYTHRPDIAAVVRPSNDGRRVTQSAAPVDRVLASTPAHFQEDLDTNAALDAPDFGYAMGDTSLAAEEQGPEADDGISVRVKAKRYENSVYLDCCAVAMDVSNVICSGLAFPDLGRAPRRVPR